MCDYCGRPDCEEGVDCPAFGRLQALNNARTSLGWTMKRHGDPYGYLKAAVTAINRAMEMEGHPSNPMRPGA